MMQPVHKAKLEFEWRYFQIVTGALKDYSLEVG
jgi:hypothetical protein